MAKKAQAVSADEQLKAALVPEAEQLYTVPKNWAWTRLESVVELISGRDVPIPLCNDQQLGIPYILGASNLENDIFSVERWIENPVVVSKRGDVLLSVKGTIGKIYLQQEPEINISRQIMALRVLPALGNSYLKYYLRCIADAIIEKGNGLIPGISREIVLRQELPLPPLPEQHRIVARIESLFEKLDRARELAQNALETFETRKAAILHKAFTGELTAKWREENGENTPWRKSVLKDVLLEKPRNGYSPVGVNYKTKVKNLTLSATTSGVFKKECFKYVDIVLDDDSYLWLKNGDILLQRANSIDYVGACAIYEGQDKEYIYPDLMMKIKINPDVINTKYLYFVLSYDEAKIYFRQNATGTAGNMPKINQNTVMNLPVIIPSLIEQQEIVRILDSLLEKEQQAKELTDVVEQIDLMKKAILARAFRGELGTNDPNEENATGLLGKILKQNID